MTNRLIFFLLGCDFKKIPGLKIDLISAFIFLSWKTGSSWSLQRQEPKCVCTMNYNYIVKFELMTVTQNYCCLLMRKVKNYLLSPSLDASACAASFTDTLHERSGESVTLLILRQNNNECSWRAAVTGDSSRRTINIIQAAHMCSLCAHCVSVRSHPSCFDNLLVIHDWGRAEGHRAESVSGCSLPDHRPCQGPSSSLLRTSDWSAAAEEQLNNHRQ